MSETFGPQMVAAIDAAWLSQDQQQMIDFARRAAVFCTESTLARDAEEAMAWAQMFAYIQRLQVDAIGRDIA